MPLTEEQKKRIQSRMGQAPSRPAAASPSGLPPAIQAVANTVPGARPYIQSAGPTGPRMGFPLPQDVIEQQLGMEAAKAVVRNSVPKASETLKRDYSRIDAFEGVLDDMEKLSKTVRKGPVQGRYVRAGAKMTGGGKFPGVDEREAENAVTYDDLRPSVAAGLYRAVTGDDRISDRDAAQRAMAFVPTLALTEKAFAKRLRVVRRAIARKRDSIKESTTLGMSGGDTSAAFFSTMSDALDEELNEDE